MKIVIRDKRFKHSCYNQYKVIYEIEPKYIDNSIPLTPHAIEHWQKTKNNIGYAGMRGLTIEDIKSIISASRRAEAHMNIERWGRVAFYKIDRKDIANPLTKLWN